MSERKSEIYCKAAVVHSRKNIDRFKSMLQTAFDEKTHKLKKANYSKPCILLLLDSYLLTDEELFQTVAKEISGLDYFFDAYVVTFNGEVTPLKQLEIKEN